MTETIEAPTGTASHDYEAERTVLAACLNDPATIARARRTLTPDSFWNTAHSALFASMLAVDDESHQVSPYTIYDQMQRAGKLGADGTVANRIHDLYAFPYLPAVGHAIGRVAKLARQRERAAVARKFAQIGDTYEDPDAAADAWAQAALELEVLIDDATDEDDQVPGLSTWDEFMNRPPKPSDSVVPGLLDRQEAVMILAAPGVGKSWLSRQVALTVATGIHPFAPKRQIPPMRTLLIDLENPESTVQRQTANPYANVQRFSGVTAGDNGWTWMYPQGLNIRKRVDAALLERVIDQTRPDLVCVGSLYNLFSRGSSDWDTAAEETIAVLNKLRARYRCAWWIEHHQPRSSDGGHRTSPFGSTLWERWPSYGRVISRIGGQSYDFAVFRGDREAGREFPAGLRRGSSTELPWSAIWDREEVELIRQNFPGGAS